MADNVIKAVFASGRRVKTAPLWRYDHGIRLLPIGLELPEHYEMHFSNSKTGEAKTVLADSAGAVIPAEYLIPGTEVYAWIYLVGDSYGRTKAEIIIPVDLKAQPTDQEPTPEQESALETAIQTLNTMIGDIQGQIDAALEDAKESGEFDGPPGPMPDMSAYRTAEEQNSIDAAQTNEIASVKNALSGSIQLPKWEKGSFDTTTGANYNAATAYIRSQSKIGFSTGHYKIQAADGYVFLLFAWDVNGNYIGSRKADGSFNKVTSNYGMLQEYDTSAYSNYVFKVALRRDPSSADIAASEGTNLSVEINLSAGIGSVATPEMFGAVGDGATDDTAALQAALDTRLPVRLEQGKTYIVTALTGYHGMVIDGNGATLKRPNLKASPYNWTDEKIKWNRFFSLLDNIGENTQDRQCVFKNIVFDGSAFEMWSESDQYKYEQASFIALAGYPNHTVSVVVDGCTFLDNFASAISASVYTDLKISNTTCKNCFKGLVTFVGYGSKLLVNNVEVKNDYVTFESINTEINFNDIATDPPSFIEINNAYVERNLKLGSVPLGGSVVVNNLVARKLHGMALLTGDSLLISNSTFQLDNDSEDAFLIYTAQGASLEKRNHVISFVNCSFLGNADNRGCLGYSGVGAGTMNVIFENCSFNGLHKALSVSNTVDGRRVWFKNCVFRNISGAIVAPRGSNTTFALASIAFSACYVAIDGYLVQHTGYTTVPRIKFDHNEVKQSAGLYLYGLRVNTIAFDGDIWDGGFAVRYYRSSGNYPNVFGERWRVLAEAPTGTQAFGGVDKAIDTTTGTQYAFTGGAWVEQ